MNADTEVAPTAPAVERWTRHHIWLHWLAALLIAAQFVSGQWMPALFAARVESPGAGEGASGSWFAPLHIALGVTVFVLTAARLRDRLVHGRPPHPSGEPGWARRLARIVQVSLYALVLAMPIAGLVAWFGANESLAALHSLAAKLLLALLALHVAGALANHYWFGTDVLRRMLPGHGRPTGIERQPGAVLADDRAPPDRRRQPR